MDRVCLTHPNLPGQRIEVRTAAVAVYEQSGWQREPDEPAETPAEEPEPKPRRRRPPEAATTEPPADHT